MTEKLLNTIVEDATRNPRIIMGELSIIRLLVELIRTVDLGCHIRRELEDEV